MITILPKSVWSYMQEQLREKDIRIHTLERQVDALHAQGLTVAPPAPEAPAPQPPLPQEILDVLDGIEDLDAYMEYEELARTRLDRGADPQLVAATLFDG